MFIVYFILKFFKGSNRKEKCSLWGEECRNPLWSLAPLRKAGWGPWGGWEAGMPCLGAPTLFKDVLNQGWCCSRSAAGPKEIMLISEVDSSEWCVLTKSPPQCLDSFVRCLTLLNPGEETRWGAGGQQTSRRTKAEFSASFRERGGSESDFYFGLRKF